MSSVLPYTPANSPASKKGGWRDGVCITVGVGLLLPLLPGPSMMAQETFAKGEFLWSFLWGVTATVILTLALLFLLVGMTHGARTGIRKFFRDRPNLLGLGFLGGILASILLIGQMISLALLMFRSNETFVAMNYVGGAVFFAVTLICCLWGFINWVLELTSSTSQNYIQAAKDGNPHDF